MYSWFAAPARSHHVHIMCTSFLEADQHRSTHPGNEDFDHLRSSSIPKKSHPQCFILVLHPDNSCHIPPKPKTPGLRTSFPTQYGTLLHDTFVTGHSPRIRKKKHLTNKAPAPIPALLLLISIYSICIKYMLKAAVP